jgi:hypothetical protein
MVISTPTVQPQQPTRFGPPTTPSAAGLGAPQQRPSLPQGFSTIPDPVNLSRPGTASGFPSPATSDSFNPAKPSFLPLSPVGSPASVGGTGMLTPAQQTGKQVGDLLTALFEKIPALQRYNPVIQEKIQGIDLKEDLEPQLKKLQARLHQIMVHLPKMVTHKAICLIDDPQLEGMATEVDSWARQTPDPAALAEINQPKARPHRPSTAGRLDVDGLGDESEDNFGDDEAEKPQSLIDRTRDKAKTTYSNLRERISSDKAEDEAPLHKTGRSPHRPSHGVESDDLESMLRGGSPSEDEDDFSPSVRRHVSHPSKDRY